MKVVILPHQLNAVRIQCLNEIEDDTEFDFGGGFVSYNYHEGQMDLRTFENCLQWLHENENIKIDFGNCEGVGTKNFIQWVYYG